MPDVTSEPTNTERVMKSDKTKGNARGVLKLGDGVPTPNAPPMPKWTIEQCAKSIREDMRSVLAIVRNDTLRMKIQQRLVETMVKMVGEPKTEVSGGQNLPTIYWSHDRGFSLSNQAPEERYQASPHETDIVELIIPNDWK